MRVPGELWKAGPPHSRSLGEARRPGGRRDSRGSCTAEWDCWPVAAPASDISSCPTRITQNLPGRTLPGKELLDCVWDFKVRIL